MIKNRSMEVRIVTVLFENRISPREIPYFRGCIIRLAEDNRLFHNHTEDGFAYSYPLVQYKSLQGQAAIIGINDVGEKLENMFQPLACFPCQWGLRRLNMRVASVNSEVCSVEVCDRPKIYTIDSWLPINQHNYMEYRQAVSLRERIAMLEKILVGNILSFAKGVRIFLDTQVECEIMQLEQLEHVTYKGVKLMRFAAVFCTNVSLPDNIGLGKSASINHGIIRNKKQINYE